MVSNMNLRKIILFILVVVGFGGLYLNGAIRHGTAVNTQQDDFDQSAYINEAISIKKYRYTNYYPRNRMPVYGFLLSLLVDLEKMETKQIEQFHQKAIHHPDYHKKAHYIPKSWAAYLEKYPDVQHTNQIPLILGDELFKIWETTGKEVWQEMVRLIFRKAKILNAILSFALLLLIAAFFYMQFSGNLGLILPPILIISNTLFLFKAGYVQCELLFYTLFFFCFFLALKSFDKKAALLAGGLFALCYLTKASVLFLLIITIVFQLVKAFSKSPLQFRKLIPCLIFVGAFLLFVNPYIRTNKKVFGNYFYNVNSTFYMWYDSWDEALAGTNKHSDMIYYPNMPADEIPSFKKYWETHSLRQMKDRLHQGLYTIGLHAKSGYGYFKYFLFYLIFAISLALIHFKKTFRLDKQNRWTFFFKTVFFGGYFLLFCWYSNISYGNRFVLSLYLPFFYVVLKFIHNQAPVNIKVGNRLTLDLKIVFHHIMLLLILVESYDILSNRIYTMQAGL